MIRVGVIGCGYWGPNLVRAFNECNGAVVTAVCDLDKRCVDRIRSRQPTIKGYHDASQLLTQGDVDLVVIATPVGSHFALAREAIACAKHVLVEKPLTQTAAEAEELIDLSERQGVLLAVDHTFLFTPAVEKMKELIDAGGLGRINFIDSVRINLGLIRQEISVIWDLAPHDLSIIDYLLGRTPQRVIATGASHLSGGQVDVAYINLDFGGGLIANVHLNWLSPVKVRRMIFGGDRKVLIFDDLSNVEKIRVYDSGAAPVPEAASIESDGRQRVDYRGGDIWTPYLPPREALAAEAEHVVAAIVSGRPLRADGRSGLRVIRILEACHRSLLDDGRRILMDEPLHKIEASQDARRVPVPFEDFAEPSRQVRQSEPCVSRAQVHRH